MPQFERKYVYEDERNKKRDRFQVEFSSDERQEFTTWQLAIEQSKDATALKQLARLGYLAISNHREFMACYRDTLLKNERNNKRIGVNPQIEVQRKIHG